MDHAGSIIASYALTLGGIAVFIWRMLRRGRALSRDVPVEDRPWT